METPGFCANLAGCQVARSGAVLAIPLGLDFVCPGCGLLLLPPKPTTNRKISPMTVAGLGIAAVASVGVVIGVAMRLTEQPPTPVTARYVPARAGAVPKAVPVAKAMPLAAPAPAQTAALAPPPPVPTAGAAAPAAPAPMPSAAQPLTPALAQPAQAVPGPALPAPAMQVAATPAKPAAQPQAIQVLQVPGVSAAAPAAPVQPDRPFNTVPVAGGLPAYPAALAADGRPGNVTVDCRIGADGRPSHCRVVQSNATPFAAATMDWLKSGTLRFAPIVHNGQPVTETHRWSLRIEESADARRSAREAAAATPAPTPAPAPAPAVAEVAAPARPQPPIAAAPKPVAAAPTLAPGDRPFSPRLLSRSAPDYPEQYADQNLDGRVSVSCMIDTGGRPNACHVLQVTGGRGFATSVEEWLHGGSVRFAPILRGGVPVAEEHSWTVEIHP